MDFCISCSKELTNDDIGFHKKMVNRGATEYMCVECLSKHFGIEVEKSRQMIEKFRESGCTLFV
ncbi:MAG: hypothetical protein PUB85_05670 [Clostridia bacterium]|nr:hypothetical protein [Oscillospiraceae bacterium]MDD6220459.1 hypothetical protein [Clostridia bacterium]